MDKIHISHEFYSSYANAYGVWELINDGISIRRNFVRVVEGRTTDEALYNARMFAKARRDEFEQSQADN